MQQKIKVDRLLTEKFFPQTREEFEKVYPDAPYSPAPPGSRQKAIDRTTVLLEGMPMGRAVYELVRENWETLPPWEEVVLEAKPYLRSEESFEEWRRKSNWERALALGIVTEKVEDASKE